MLLFEPFCELGCVEAPGLCASKRFAERRLLALLCVAGQYPSHGLVELEDERELHVFVLEIRHDDIRTGENIVRLLRRRGRPHLEKLYLGALVRVLNALDLASPFCVVCGSESLSRRCLHREPELELCSAQESQSHEARHSKRTRT